MIDLLLHTSSAYINNINFFKYFTGNIVTVIDIETKQKIIKNRLFVHNLELVEQPNTMCTFIPMHNCRYTDTTCILFRWG